MKTTEGPPPILETPNTSLAVAAHLLAWQDQPTEARIRELVGLCRQFSQQYQEDGEVCLARSWWRLFNQAGTCLREVLDQAKAEGYRGLNDGELEQAYFLLIHVAYFFEPGGIAETLWPLLPTEAGNQHMRPPTNEALGVVLAPPPAVSMGTRMRQQISRWRQRLGQLLFGGDARNRERANLLAHSTQGFPPLEEAAEPPRPLVTRGSPDGTHPGR